MTKHRRHRIRIALVIAALVTASVLLAALVGLAAAVPGRREARMASKASRAAGVKLAASSSRGARRVPYVWYSGKTRKTVYRATDEVAVLLDPGAALSAGRKAALVRKLGAGARVISGSSDYVAFVRLAAAAAEKALRRAPSLKREPGIREVSPVFSAGAAGTGGKSALTGEVIVAFSKSISTRAAKGFAARRRLSVVKRFSFAPNVYLLRSSSALGSLADANALRRIGTVVYAAPNWLRTRTKRAVPNDPLYAGQWHLKNTSQGGGTAGEDINVEGAWNSYKGSTNEVIAIVDDGLETGHEDLSANTALGGHWDWNDNNADPSPGSTDDHGTACAGVAAARGFNALGVTGAAPQARLVGYRLLGANTDANEAAALTRNSSVIDIASNSWGPIDDRHLEGPGPVTEAALASGASSGRGGKGLIYAWAGGNGGDAGDDSNLDGYANSRYTIAVGASNNTGQRSYYSETGANLIVNAPSSGDVGLDGGTLGITTTDRTGTAGYNPGGTPGNLPDANYTNDFGGTSSAAPLVSGVCALLLQANPNLGWRDVQQVLARTASKNDPTDADWTTNGAGYHINHNYGFGRVDASSAVSLATTWTPVAEEESASASATPNLSIPDNNATGVSSALDLSGDLKVECVEVRFSAADHTWWNDLEITLMSPSGTKSVLAPAGLDTALTGDGYSNWRFSSARHLGESSKGNWKLTVKDLAADDTGTFQSWSIKVYGREPGPWGTLAINNGASYTTTTSVSLDSTIGGATEMRVRNLGDSWPIDWEPYTQHNPWTLPAGDGDKTVEAEFRDAAGNVLASSDSIVLQRGAPSAPSGFCATRGNRRVDLVWVDPGGDFSFTRIIRSMSAYPSSPNPGAGQVLVYEGSAHATADTGLVNGANHYYSAFARDFAGNWSVRSVVSAVPAAPTALSVSARAVSVAYGTPVRIRGSLTSGGSLLKNRTNIAVWRSLNGTTWSRDGSVAYNETGLRYEATRTITARTFFQLRYGGEAAFVPSTSTPATVTCRAYLPTPWLSTTSPVRGRYFDIYGYLRPRHSGRTKLYFYRRVGGVWAYFTYRYATNYDYSSYTRYRLTYRLAGAGTWYVRAYHADFNHLATTSGAHVFRVR